MKVVIFAGGLGTRLSEESHLRPKPMVEVGGKPILWHIMKIYEQQGFNDFVICLGYKGYMVKEYFYHYFIHNSDLSIDLQNNKVEILESHKETFRMTLVDTGLNTMTAGRLRRIRQHVGNEDFMLTYGDGVADIDLQELVRFHKAHGKVATVTAIQPAGKFGTLQIEADHRVSRFVEKPASDGSWINGGFFVLSPKIFDYLHENSDQIMWETQPMDDLARDEQIAAFRHNGFWKCMDTLRDKHELETMWESGKAKWKIW